MVSKINVKKQKENKKKKGKKSKYDAEFILKNKETLIKKRKRKKRLIKLFILIIVIMIVLISVALNSKEFNITDISIEGLNIVDKGKVEEQIAFKKGDNIFKIHGRDTKNKIKALTYVDSVSLIRKLPNKVVVKVKEKVPKFYVHKDDKFIIVDDNCTVLDVRNNIDNLGLIELVGLDNSKEDIGQKLGADEERKFEYVKEFYNLVSKNTSSVTFTKLDFTSMIDIKAYSKDLEIKLGTKEKLMDKLNKAINIIESQNLYDKKGYIDVSFDGNPVIHMD